MGLFKRKKKERDKSAYQWMTVDEALAYSRGEEVVTQASIINALDENKAQLSHTRRQQEDAKAEFMSVTTYLSDIQKIGLIEGEERKNIIDYATSIIELKAERDGFIKSERTLTPKQYGTFQMYENIVPEQLKKMEDNERYLSLVNNDIKQLEGEKGSIRYEIEELTKRQTDLRKFLIGTCVFFGVVLIALIVISQMTGTDLLVPFLVAAFAAVSVAMYVFVSMRRTTVTLMQDEAKLNRAISLLNKVKIKYVNTTSVLDYSYEKFGVDSHHEFKYRWQQYQKEQQLEERHKRNAEMLRDYQTQLIRALQRAQVTDPSVWAQQPEPIVDKAAMAELTMNLNDRRQKLRAAIEFGNKQIDLLDEEIKNLIQKHPAQEKVIRALMEEYRL